MDSFHANGIEAFDKSNCFLGETSCWRIADLCQQNFYSCFPGKDEMKTCLPDKALFRALIIRH